MSVTHFNLEHKIKPGVKCRINFLACTSPWSITQLLSKPVWGLPPTLERTDQLWYDKYQPLLFSWFCSMLPRCSKKWCPGVHGTRRGCKSTQTKIQRKKNASCMALPWSDLKLLCSLQEGLSYAHSSFYVSPAGMGFLGFCLLRFVRINAPALPGSPETMLIMLPFCFQTWEAIKSLTAAWRQQNSHTLQQPLPWSLNVQRQGQPHVRILPTLEKSQTIWY